MSQINQEDKAVADAFSTSSGSENSYPSRLSPAFSLGEGDSDGRERLFFPGLYLVSGAAKSGKSTGMLCLQHRLNKHGQKTVYKSFGEPRSGEPISCLQRWNKTYASWLVEASGSGVRALIIDSVTYGLSCDPVAFSLVPEGVGTMKEGLELGHVLAVLMMDAAARAQGIVLFGVINSELFPRTDVLRGACEGFVQVRGPSAMAIESRGTLRRSFELAFSADELSWANLTLSGTDVSELGSSTGVI